jgi:hypothetical protein
LPADISKRHRIIPNIKTSNIQQTPGINKTAALSKPDQRKRKSMQNMKTKIWSMLWFIMLQICNSRYSDLNRFDIVVLFIAND